MSHYHPPPRRILTHSASRKRKETESSYPLPGPPPTPPPLPVAAKIMAPPSKASEPPRSSNRLLAGYLAHEFLTKGTLLGQKFDPARAEAVPLSSRSSTEQRRGKPSLLGKEKVAEPNRKVKPNNTNSQSYAELANLLKTDGAHIPGIINPTQLSRWIQM